MADDTSAPDSRRAMQVYGTIIIVGGGCYGSYYLRQLSRAHAARAVDWRDIVIVDRNADCAARKLAAELATPRVAIVQDDWEAYFRAYLGAAAQEPALHASDAVVPSPLMPHLMADWLSVRARERWPHRRVETQAIGHEPAVPWQRSGEDGTHYVSFAEWMCPINCIEPARCPATRGDRTWSMPQAVEQYAIAERSAERPVAGPFVFHCTHRVFGVGMIDVADVLAADATIATLPSNTPTELLIGTASHCHGALRRVRIGA